MAQATMTASERQAVDSIVSKLLSMYGFRTDVFSFLWSNQVDAATDPSYASLTVTGGDVSINGVAYTWPANNGGPGEFLTTDGDGLLTWSAPGGAGIWQSSLGVISPVAGTDNLALGGAAGTEKLHITGNATVSGTVAAGTLTGQGKNITLATISSHHKGLQEFHNIIGSAGWIHDTSAPRIVDNLDGTINVAGGSGMARPTNGPRAELTYFDWLPETNVALTDESNNFIYADYNGGSPIITVSTTEDTADYQTKFLLGVVSRGGTHIHINEEFFDDAGDTNKKVTRFHREIDPYAHASGAIISEVGTRSIALTAGAFWHGLHKYTTPAFDSSGADTFESLYSDGSGGWEEVEDATQIDNASYDDGSGTLAPLPPGTYGVHWVYLLPVGDVYTLYGTAAYTLSQASSVQAPAQSTLPSQLSINGRIVGKIVVAQGASTFTSIETPFDSGFRGSVFNHAALDNLGSDSHSQYALLAGRTGGQSLVGGSDASDSLTLSSSSGGITGYVLIAPSGEKVGIGTLTPTNAVSIVGKVDVTSTTGSALELNTTSTANNPSFALYPIGNFTDDAGTIPHSGIDWSPSWTIANSSTALYSGLKILDYSTITDGDGGASTVTTNERTGEISRTSTVAAASTLTADKAVLLVKNDLSGPGTINDTAPVLEVENTGTTSTGPTLKLTQLSSGGYLIRGNNGFNDRFIVDQSGDIYGSDIADDSISISGSTDTLAGQVRSDSAVYFSHDRFTDGAYPYHRIDMEFRGTGFGLGKQAGLVVDAFVDSGTNDTVGDVYGLEATVNTSASTYTLIAANLVGANVLATHRGGTITDLYGVKVLTSSNDDSGSFESHTTGDMYGGLFETSPGGTGDELGTQYGLVVRNLSGTETPDYATGLLVEKTGATTPAYVRGIVVPEHTTGTTSNILLALGSDGIGVAGDYAIYSASTKVSSFAGSILPATDDSIDLGDDTHRWKDVYVGPGSIHIGTSTSDEAVLTYNTGADALELNRIIMVEVDGDSTTAESNRFYHHATGDDAFFGGLDVQVSTTAADTDITDTLYGLYSWAGTSATGAVNKAVSYWSQISADTSGSSISEAYGFLVDINSGAGDLVRSTGIQIANSVITGNTHKRGVTVSEQTGASTSNVNLALGPILTTDITGDYSIYNSSTKANRFNSHLELTNGGSASELRLFEPDGSGAHYTAFKAQAQAGTVTYVLPAADATVSGYVLSSNAAGTLSWIAQASGGITGTLTSGRVPYASGVSTVTDSANMTFDGTHLTLGGDLAVNGDDLTTTQTTFNLINTNAGTVNAFGAATAIIIGASTGTTRINNLLRLTSATDTAVSPTVNAPSGRVRIAAGNSSVVVSNNFVTASCKVFTTFVGSAVDATLTSVAVACTADTITITGNAAATANVDIDFIVIR